MELKTKYCMLMFASCALSAMEKSTQEKERLSFFIEHFIPYDQNYSHDELKEIFIALHRLHSKYLITLAILKKPNYSETATQLNLYLRHRSFPLYISPDLEYIHDNDGNALYLNGLLALEK